MTALDAIGGDRPPKAEEFARRAYAHALNPNQNPVRRIMCQAESFEKTPPLLGIFNDIAWHQLRESDVHAWASAGFSWIVNDAEHSQLEGWYTREKNAMLGRMGILPVQRLYREAISTHGDALQVGARATMRPYATTYEETEAYLEAIRFPTPGSPTIHSRGGFPVREGDRTMTFTPESLREAEVETQGWVQFETGEYILDTELRDQVLELMAKQGEHKTCGFVGPFDAILREGATPQMEQAVSELFKKAASLNIHMGRVVGSGSMLDPKDIEDAMVKAIEDGARIIAVHYMTSDIAYLGAKNIADPFFKAAKRCGF
jgi:2-keto-3-deoxy-L-rhamnonate aldolase RhmA